MLLDRLKLVSRSSDAPLVLPVVVDSTAPVLLVISPPALDMAWVERQGREFERFYERGERYAVVSYSGFVRAMPGARERKALTDFANDHREVQKRLCVGAATQLDSPAKRAFLQALLWMWDPPYPHTTHATLEQSVDWCIERLLAERLHVPDRLRAKVLQMVRAMHHTVDAATPPALRVARR